MAQLNAIGEYRLALMKVRELLLFLTKEDIDDSSDFYYMLIHLESVLFDVLAEMTELYNDIDCTCILCKKSIYTTGDKT